MKFSDHMIEAIRNKTKTMTRRPIKPQPVGELEHLGFRAWHDPLSAVNDEKFHFSKCCAGEFHPVESPDGNDTSLRIRILRVWPERLQDISEVDARKEGCSGGTYVPYEGDDATAEFAALWDTFYGDTEYAWRFDPMVWAIEFKLIEEGE